MNSFAEQLRKLRKKHMITQIQLAGQLNVSPTTVQKWETGLSYPDLSSIHQLKVIFGVTYSYLIDGEEDSKNVTHPTLSQIIKAFKETEAHTSKKRISDDFKASFFSHMLLAQLYPTE